MFYRAKKNKSGSISIQIIEKIDGKNKVIYTVGSSSQSSEIEILKQKAQEYIYHYQGQQTIKLFENEEDSWFDTIFKQINNLYLLGPELLLGKIFDQIGFNQIQDELFKDLVIGRIIYPSSKLKTVRYLESYSQKQYDVYQVYRYLDKLYNTQKTIVEEISYRHTKEILPDQQSILFYDVTTLYFESEQEDELRVTGFSKEGKHQNPQIVLGLLVSVGGYPLAYDVFKGNTYEGNTMLPIIDGFKQKYQLEKLVIIADSGLINTSNIEQLTQKGYEFIIGARIKSEKNTIKNKILSYEFKDGSNQIIDKEDNIRLLVNYAEKRAKKDAYNRKRGLEKLEKSLKSGKLNKKHINNRGYNKYLKMEGDVNVKIDYQKFEQDAKWDGLKGYVTNTKLEAAKLIANYNELWNIEKAFRMSKTDLKIRPVYHGLQRRIEAHICISFVAYKVLKELERQLKVKKSSYSTERVIEILSTIFGIQLVHPINNKTKTMLFLNNNSQRKIVKMFDIHFG